MIATVVRKLVGLVLTLFVTSAIVFFSMYLAPGNPISFLISGRTATPEQIAALEAQYGLNEPVGLQYFHWLGNVVQGNFGTSIQFHENVGVLLASRLPTTIGLVVIAAIIIGVVGLVLGGIGALRNGKPSDHGIVVLLSGFAAVPAFVAALVLISIFAVGLGWFPAQGSGAGFLDFVYHLVLPAVALAIAFIAVVGRITRESMIDQLGREHVEVALSRGLTYPSVIRRHVFRNSLGPISTVAALVVAGLVVSSSVVESSFGLSGIGSLLIQAVDRKDFPVVQAIVLLVVVAFVVVNTIVDLLAPVIDPRISAKGATR